MSKAIISLSGTVGKDADIRSTANGFMASFPVAANSRQKSKGGEWSDVATWFEVTVFAKNEGYLEGQFFKGAKCFVSGELVNSPWTDRDGNQRSTLRVTANHAEGLTKREGQAPRRAAQADDFGLDDVMDVPW